MGNEIKDLIKEMKEKIESLISENIENKNDINDLITNRKKLQEEIENLKKRVSESESKYEDLKMSKILLTSVKDKYEAKDKISSIVREIDNCIALLNN